MTIHMHIGDLPPGLLTSGPIAVDTETLGLNPHRDRLCLVQLADGTGDEHLVQIPAGHRDAPNLKAVLSNPDQVKIFHFARFDVAMLRQYLDVDVAPIFCTKIASRLVRTYTDRHGLKDLVRELLQADISKQQQSSDWGAQTLTEAQMEYAASDVRYLHRLMDILSDRLIRDGRSDIAAACFAFLPTRARLDLAGWPETDIFSHTG